jgi:hypothetical protein
MERPLGVTILAVVALISGALGVLKGLVALDWAVAASWMATSYPVAGAVVGVLAVTYGVVALPRVLLAWLRLRRLESQVVGLDAWRYHRGRNADLGLSDRDRPRHPAWSAVDHRSGRSDSPVPDGPDIKSAFGRDPGAGTASSRSP